MKTKQVPVDTLTQGDKVWRHGILWTVDSVIYDARGNAVCHQENQPRYVVNCHLEPQGYAQYTTNMSLGYRVEDLATIPA